MLVPYAVGIVLLFILPAILSFSLAFFQYDGLSAPRWVGVLNFILAYTDELFRLSVHNALALIILPAPVRVMGAFLAARLLLRGGRGLMWARAAVFLPSVTPGVVYALAWLWILNPLYGPLNLILRAIGITPPVWLADAAWAKPGVALALLWAIGEGFLVSLAALHDIPTALEDAARVDGASAWDVLRHITLPLIGPVLLLLLFRDAAWLLQESFATVWLMTRGGPYYATYTLPLFIYEQGFSKLMFGVASAALWMLYALTGGVIVALYGIARQWNLGSAEDTFLL